MSSTSTGGRGQWVWPTLVPCCSTLHVNSFMCCVGMVSQNDLIAAILLCVVWWWWWWERGVVMGVASEGVIVF